MGASEHGKQARGSSVPCRWCGGNKRAPTGLPWAAFCRGSLEQLESCFFGTLPSRCKTSAVVRNPSATVLRVMSLYGRTSFVLSADGQGGW